MILYLKDFAGDVIIRSNINYILRHKDEFQCGEDICELEGYDETVAEGETLIIIGHGEKDGRIGGYDSDGLLALLQGKIENVKRIIMFCCYAGYKPEDSSDSLVEQMAKKLDNVKVVIGKTGQALNYAYEGLDYELVVETSILNAGEEDIEADIIYSAIQQNVIENIFPDRSLPAVSGDVNPENCMEAAKLLFSLYDILLKISNGDVPEYVKTFFKEYGIEDDVKIAELCTSIFKRKDSRLVAVKTDGEVQPKCDNNRYYEK